MRQKFKLFVGRATSTHVLDTDNTALDSRMNNWAADLPSGSKIRRTQLAATDVWVVALVNYEEPEGTT